MSRNCAVIVSLAIMVAFGCGPKEPVQKFTKPSTSKVPAQGQESKSEITDSTVEPDSKDLVMDWPQFRGPSWLATTSEAQVPIRWKASEGIVWKASLIGRGASSPIVLGDRVFVTAFTGYGMSPENRGKVSDLQHHVICLDKNSGQQIWKRTIQGSYANQKLSENVLGHGFASSTPVTDGKSLFAFFGISGVFAFDLDGKFLWQTDVGVLSDNFGSSASLTVFEDLVYVNASIENKTLFALNKETGRAVWKFDGIERSWSTPVIGMTDEGSPELIFNETDTVHGFDPRTGEELWHCEGIQDYVVAVPVVVDGVCYVNGGREKRCMAIRLGGRGDVTETHKIWEIPKGANVSSPVYHDGKLYLASDNGIMQCFDAESGEDLHRQRLGSKNRILASPTLVGDHLFLPTQRRGVVVMNINNDCKIMAKNVFKDDDTPLQASFAASGNRLFIRSDRYLYCIGQSENETQTVALTESESDAEIIIPTRKYDFDENEGKPKQYLGYFITDPDEMVEFILKPYLSVITPEQTAKSTELIKANHQLFVELRQQHLHLHWRFMRGNLAEDEFIKKLTRIENLTMRQNRKVRKMVKDMFSKEQMDQHIREAKERAAMRAK